MFNLTDEQSTAIFAKDGVVLRAAAGSGKTSVLVSRYLELLKNYGDSKNILAVAFTNEAADQLKERILLNLNEPLRSNVIENARIGTIHSFCFQILAKHGGLLELPPFESIATPFDFTLHFETAYEEWISRLTEQTLGRLLSLVSAAELRQSLKECFFIRNLVSLTSPSENLSFVFNTFQSFFKTLEKSLWQKGLYGFDDLEYFADQLLTRFPFLIKDLNVSFLLVDEFQDTSRLQWRILSQLVDRTFSNLFAVGDPTQSIYRFRHADVANFMDVVREVEKNNGSRLSLRKNFRSEPKLLDRINSFGQFLFGASFESMTAAEILPSDFVPVSIQHYAQGEQESLYLGEISCVVNYVSRLSKKAGPGSLALLFRNSDRIREYARAFQLTNIPVCCEFQVPLFQCYDVLDICNYLRTVNDPHDDFSFAAFLRSRPLGFSAQDLWEIKSREGKSFFEKCAAEPKLQWFFRLVENGETDLNKLLSELFRNTQTWPYESEAFHHFLKPLLSSDSLAEAVQKINVWEREEILVPSSDLGDRKHSVRLFTVHAAKGLEFDHVLLVDNLRISPKRSPKILFALGEPPALRTTEVGEDYRSLQDKVALEDAQESRRVLYVAITRAKQSLTAFLPQDASLIPKNSWGRWLADGLFLESGEGSL